MNYASCIIIIKPSDFEKMPTKHGKQKHSKAPISRKSTNVFGCLFSLSRLYNIFLVIFFFTHQEMALVHPNCQMVFSFFKPEPLHCLLWIIIPWLYSSKRTILYLHYYLPDTRWLLKADSKLCLLAENICFLSSSSI